MTLESGKRIGPFEIGARLGAGGMGEVWRARDTRLGRDVAVKALSAAFAQDAERLARFEREAKLLASLNHPNIAGIHGIEEVAGHRYLVLEFVDGETLANRLQRGPLPVDEALEICREISAGVEAAHESGVVHRDLKPGNVMITPAGAVKVLDFGLAKGSDPAASGSEPNLSASPTLSFQATAAGVILGTAAYMSPEQARGRAVDRRTDIWSFGCVLYECLTGKQAFEGDTISDIVARILEREPAWDALPERTPAPVRELLGRCLTKDVRRRLRDVGEARIVLEDALAVMTGGSVTGAAAGATDAEAAPVPGPKETGKRRDRMAVLLPWIVAAGAVAAAIGVGTSRHAASTGPVTLSVMLPPDVQLNAGPEYDVLAVAPDGKALCYTARTNGTIRLYYRPLDRREAVELSGTENARDPFFSPDSRWIGFFAGLKLKKISVLGGTPVDLATVSADRGGTWLDDGTIVFTSAFSSPLVRIPAEGGKVTAVTTLDSTRSERTHRWPAALPGGEWVVFTVGSLDSPGGYDDSPIEAVSLRTGERRTLSQGSMARFAPGNRLIVARKGTLYQIPLDPTDPEGGTSPVPVLDKVRGEPTSGAVFFDIARNGTLVYETGESGLEKTQLAWATKDGTFTPIPGTPRQFNQFAVSADGRRALAVIGPGGGATNIWLVDLERGTQNRLTFDENSDSPVWMPDRKRFAWLRGDDISKVVMGDVNGSDSVRVLYTPTGILSMSSTDPGGRRLYFNEYGSEDSDIWAVATDGSGPPERVVSEPRSQSAAAVSPDGQWIAYQSGESGRSEVMVSSLTRRGFRSQISTQGGGTPQWSPDGAEIYFTSSDAVYGAAVHESGEGLQVDPPRQLFGLPGISGDSSIRDYAVDPRTGRFLVRMPTEGTAERREITVSLGWAGTLDRRKGTP